MRPNPLAPWELRIGINTGPVIAGVVGTKHYTYDVWGSAVNAAARLEQTSEPGRINISSSTLHYVEHLFDTEFRGNLKVKNMGSIDMHYLNRIRSGFSDTEDQCAPNNEFWSKMST